MSPSLAVVFFSLAASLACRALAKGVFGNSLDEAEAEEGFVGVFVFVGVGVEAVTLCESGVLAVGVVGFFSTFTLAALASLSRLVEVGLGVSFILRLVVGPLAGAAVVVVLAGALTSGLRLLAGLAVVVVVVGVGLPVIGLLVAGLADGFCGAVAGLAVTLAVAALDEAVDLVVVALAGLVVALVVAGGTNGLLDVTLGLGVALELRGSLGFPAGLLVVVLVKANVDGGLGDFLVVVAVTPTAAPAATAPTAATAATGVSVT